MCFMRSKAAEGVTRSAMTRSGEGEEAVGAVVWVGFGVGILLAGVATAHFASRKFAGLRRVESTMYEGEELPAGWESTWLEADGALPPTQQTGQAAPAPQVPPPGAA